MNEPKPLPSETKLVETPLTGEAISPIAADLVHLEALSNARSKVYKDGPVSNWPAANREFVHALERFYRTHRTALASLADELRLARERCARLTELLQDAKGNLIWCGGSADFGPNGQAKIGYDKGPRRTIAEIDAALKESR